MQRKIPLLDIDNKIKTTDLGSGTPDSSKFLRGDKQWSVPPAGGIATTLLSVNPTNALQPIIDFVGQIGLLELNSNGDLQPITGSESDYTLELDINDNIRPK